VERFIANAKLKRAQLTETTGEARWSLGTMRGRLVELSARGAAATLTAAVELVLEAQTQSEPVAWITLASGSFYPPDAADSGVDLNALVVVRVPDAIAAARAAERLLRSGAFGLVVLDLALGQADLSRSLSLAIQGRLVTLAQTHDAAVVCVTDKTEETSSIGSLVSLRASALRGRERDGRFHVTVRALKDKQRGPGWSWHALREGPAGLR
jgi:recombination protein RecA